MFGKELTITCGQDLEFNLEKLVILVPHVMGCPKSLRLVYSIYQEEVSFEKS